jgi:SAM-dependent methyltransferase
MNEQTKATKRRLKTGLWESIFRGRVIDIGPGGDPLKRADWPGITHLDLFDKGDGDANAIDQHCPADHYDCVHGSQVLEHLHNPWDALDRFLWITKPGGFIVMTVPCFDLYEHGYWPSRYNSDHKSTWSRWRRDAPTSAPHVHVPAITARLNRVHLSASLCADGYNWLRPDIDQTLGHAEAFIEMVLRKDP